MKKLAFAFICLTGCVRTVAEPQLPAPEKSWPLVAPPVAEEGSAQVLIDTDVPARISLDDGRELCAFTPCSFPAEYGTYRLVFQGLKDTDRKSTFTMEVQQKTVVLNHVLGREHRPIGPQAFGVVLSTVGVLITSLAVVLAVDDCNCQLSDRAPTYGMAAAAGFGLTLLGGVITLAAPTVKREGSSTQWSPTPPSAGVSWSAKF